MLAIAGVRPVHFFFRDAAIRISDLLADGDSLLLEGQDHGVPAEVVGLVFYEFLQPEVPYALRSPTTSSGCTDREVGTAGGGLMGSGIAESVARAGLSVAPHDGAAIGAAHKRVDTSLAHAVERGKVTGRGRGPPRADPARRPARVAGADLVIEAVARERAAKAGILAQVDGVLARRR